ncbi:DMT family transporter [Bacillus sp. IB182487]|uniref:DMT family transporter n=2 Tax=Metabacillus arenae TaxID=2771434 RepID=A0A926RYS0_9BACI|nr:DMT family transporter [Metabacillus arenae]
MLLNNKWIIWFLILLITVIWGYAWVLMKASLQFMGPFTFSALRFGVGSLTLLIILFVMGGGVPPKKQLKHLIIVGLLQTTIVFLLVMYGLRFVDAGKSSVLLYSMPIWSSLLAANILKEKISNRKVLGLSLGIIGLFAILGWDVLIDQNPGKIFGELLIVLAALSWGGSNVYYRLKLKNANGLQVTAYQMFFGTVGIIIAAFFMEWGQPIHITPLSIYYILFTGVLASALCFAIWFLLLRVIDTVTATLPTLLVPVFGLFFGSLLLNEKLTLNIIIGSALILAGVIIPLFFRKEKKRLLVRQMLN